MSHFLPLQSPVRKRAIVPFSRWNKLRCRVPRLRRHLASHRTLGSREAGTMMGWRRVLPRATDSHMLLEADAQALTIELKIG